METFTPPEAHQLVKFFTEFLSFSFPPPSKPQNLPYSLFQIIRAYTPPALIKDVSGISGSGGAEYLGKTYTSQSCGSHTSKIETNSYSYTLGESTIGIDFLGRVSNGSYGVLYDVNRNGVEGRFYLKTGSKSLKHEAFLQQAAYYVLKAYGLPWAVPQVYDIVSHPHYGVCFTMDAVVPALMFGTHLMRQIQWTRACRANDVLVFEIVAQIAIYILLLENVLGLNHRDLKLNNVLMVKEEPLINAPVRCSPYIHGTINASVRAVLIDFGFACIGDLEQSRFLLSADDFLPATVDMCPKVGRDMFLIFANLWNVRALRKALTPGASLLFKRWLTDVKGKDWALWLSSDIDKELIQTYNLVNNASFQAPWAKPIGVLTDIALYYPEILKMD
jgi:hypothetical protein